MRKNFISNWIEKYCNHTFIFLTSLILIILISLLIMQLFNDSAIGSFLSSLLGAGATFIVGWMAYRISKEQKEIARQKLQLDIFNKRFDAFKIFNTAYSNIIRDDAELRSKLSDLRAGKHISARGGEIRLENISKDIKDNKEDTRFPRIIELCEKISRGEEIQKLNESARLLPFLFKNISQEEIKSFLRQLDEVTKIIQRPVKMPFNIFYTTGYPCRDQKKLKDSLDEPGFENFKNFKEEFDSLRERISEDTNLSKL